jgi:hypothetical protein
MDKPLLNNKKIEEKKAKEKPKAVGCRTCRRIYKNLSGSWKNKGLRHGRSTPKLYGQDVNTLVMGQQAIAGGEETDSQRNKRYVN